MPDDDAPEVPRTATAKRAPRKAAGATKAAAGPAAGEAAIDPALLQALLSQLMLGRALPITIEQRNVTPVDTAGRLNAAGPVAVAFPPCTDVLLALIRTTGILPNEKDDLTLYFDEYFRFRQNEVLRMGGMGLETELDPGLAACLVAEGESWPPECCVCPSCIVLQGDRNPGPPGTTPPALQRLFIGDLIWLYYFERFGIFRILGVILDDFATTGRFPISNGSLDTVSRRDDLAAIMLEVMVRETKSGLSSTVRDRESSYRRCLGWSSETGRKAKLETQVNTGFSTQFHRFIYHALEFYKDRRLAVAIRGATAPEAPPSAATLVTLADTIDILKKRFEVFHYGRNYFNALNGIVWAIAAMTLVREIRTTLGIPPAYDKPHEYLPAAYDLLVAGRPVTGAESNRYTLHRECARDARDVILDIEVLDTESNTFARPGGELDQWLTQVEARIEGYRTAYRSMTGVDLGQTRDPAVDQRA